jgi:hypothetical protein
MNRGVLLKHVRPALLLLAVALFSASAWADGIDPRVIIQKGSGSIPITVNTPNPSFGPVTATQNSHCLPAGPYASPDVCVFEVFQNQTSQTLRSLTIAINDVGTYSFLCGDLSDFFSNCTPFHDNELHVWDITFSGGTGILPAIQSCVAPTAVSSVSCQTHFTGGEFGLLIDASEAGFAGQSVSGQTITTPEPDAAIMILSAALAFGLLKLLRRGA